MKNLVFGIFEFFLLSFAKLFNLIPRLIICFFLMSGSALNFSLKLVVRQYKLENVNHGVLRDALVEVSETQTLYHYIGLKSCLTNV